MIKRITCILLITIAIAVPFLGQLNFNVYAADNTESINRNELVDAFKAYCKSRDLSVEGTGLDALDNFTSSTMDSITTLLGIDLTQLQAEINKVVDPNSNTLKYYTFTALGITGFNRIFAQFLQDNDLAVGDENVDKVIYSGEWWSDDNGKGCFLYYINLSPGSSNRGYSNHGIDKSNITKYGTFIYNSGALIGMTSGIGSFNNLSFTVNGVTYSGTVSKVGGSSSTYLGYSYYNTSFAGKTRAVLSTYDGYWTFDSAGTDTYGGCSAFKFANDKIGVGFIGINSGWASVNTNQFNIACYVLPNGQTTTPTDINVKSPVIKPELPEDPSNISPDGNVTPSDQDPTEPPPDPTGGTPPDWSMDTDVEPDGDGWKIPFSLPDLDIDWKIEGLSKKFPFCIPKDIVQVVNVLNVPAQAPRFTGSVDLLVYEWDVDIDFSDFDTLSVILRNGIFILFCIGLLVITRTIIRG